MRIAPTLLNYSIEECINQFYKLSLYFNTFQIDIQDGKFITNKTILLDEYIRALKKSSHEKVSSSLFDFHFQSLSYEEDIKKLWTIKEKLQIGIIFIHYSLNPDFKHLKKIYSEFSFGIVFNPEDEVEIIGKKYNLIELPSIQIMSIHPGPQGSQFIPETLKKIEQLRLHDYRNKIYLDGAVNKDTIPLILSLKYKPDYLCIGSFLTKAVNLKERVDYLKEKVK